MKLIMVQILCTHGIVTTFTLFHTYISPHPPRPPHSVLVHPRPPTLGEPAPTLVPSPPALRPLRADNSLRKCYFQLR
jgi:hypothetical protein